jgi:putative transposase
VPELSRRYGVAENTIYRWKFKFGGMDVSDAELDKAALKELVDGKW